MKDDLNLLEYARQPQSLQNGRLPQYLGKWKMTPIFFPMEDHINFFLNEM
jgi:hypothetical protein